MLTKIMIIKFYCKRFTFLFKEIEFVFNYLKTYTRIISFTKSNVSVVK